MDLPLYSYKSNQFILMEYPVNVLIIDNRPMFVDGIRNCLISSKVCKDDTISVSNSYDHALGIVLKRKSIYCFGIIIVDVSLNDGDLSKLDLEENSIQRLKDNCPKSKIIALIRTQDNFRILTIRNRIKPDGFLIQTELNQNRLKQIISLTLKNSVYYSKSINSVLNNNSKIAKNLDERDRSIVYLISKGFKTKELSNHIDRSLSSIEKRKQKMKDLFVFKNCSDELLLKEAALHKII